MFIAIYSGDIPLEATALADVVYEVKPDFKWYIVKHPIHQAIQNHGQSSHSLGPALAIDCSWLHALGKT